MRDELSLAPRGGGRAVRQFAPQGQAHRNRETEILIQAPGYTVTLVPEPENEADGNAIAVYSPGEVQMRYIAADRTHLILEAWEDAKVVWAIFQRVTAFGAAIRIRFDGNTPSLPPADEEQRIPRLRDAPESAEDDPGFYANSTYDT